MAKMRRAVRSTRARELYKVVCVVGERWSGSIQKLGRTGRWTDGRVLSLAASSRLIPQARRDAHVRQIVV